MPTLAIAGTWRADANSDIYKFTESVAALFASKGWCIVTAGYSGVMDAGLKGARDYPVAARALTWSALEGVLPVSVHAKDAVSFDSIAKRAGTLVGDAQAVIVMPGRTGTAAELALAVEARAKRQLDLPVMVYRDYWDQFFIWLQSSNGRLWFPADSEEHESFPLFRRVFTLDDVCHVLAQEES